MGQDLVELGSGLSGSRDVFYSLKGPFGSHEVITPTVAEARGLAEVLLEFQATAVLERGLERLPGAHSGGVKVGS